MAKKTTTKSARAVPRTLAGLLAKHSPDTLVFHTETLLAPAVERQIRQQGLRSLADREGIGEDEPLEWDEDLMQVDRNDYESDEDYMEAIEEENDMLSEVAWSRTHGVYFWDTPRAALQMAETGVTGIGRGGGAWPAPAESIARSRVFVAERRGAGELRPDPLHGGGAVVTETSPVPVLAVCQYAGPTIPAAFGEGSKPGIRPADLVDPAHWRCV